MVVGYGAYALIAAAAAVTASVLYTVLLHFAPRPGLYGWIVGLVTVLAVLPLIPLTVGTALAAQLALAGINLVIGLVIICLVPVAAVRAR